jgi:hypothetical protein
LLELPMEGAHSSRVFLALDTAKRMNPSRLPMNRSVLICGPGGAGTGGLNREQKEQGAVAFHLGCFTRCLIGHSYGRIAIANLPLPLLFGLNIRRR